MRITESKIRQYIRKLLIETFNVGPDGIAIPNQAFRETLPASEAEALPSNVPQIDRSFPVKLAMAAKKEYEDTQQKNPAVFELLKQKALPLAFGFTYDELLENLTFTPSDLKYINIDIKVYLSDRSNFNQAMSLLGSLMPETAAYLEHITAATDDFSRDESNVQSTTLDPGEGRILHDDVISIFFRQPDNPNHKGLGKSLTDSVIDKIMSSLLQVQNMTPIEFASTFLPEFYKIIDIHFQKNPIIAQNAEALKPVRDGYLDSIEWVLTELIAELNFEFLYWGSGKNLTSKNPEDLLIFLPDDRSTLVTASKAAHKQSAEDSYWDFKTYLGDIYRPEKDMVSNLPELRSFPDYYTMKFSINPRFASVAGAELKNKFNQRLWDNMYFGVGFKYEGVSIPASLDDGGIGNLWEKS